MQGTILSFLRNNLGNFNHCRTMSAAGAMTTKT